MALKTRSGTRFRKYSLGPQDNSHPGVSIRIVGLHLVTELGGTRVGWHRCGDGVTWCGQCLDSVEF